MTNIRENIQKNIVKYRKEAKMTQAELARKIEISSPTLASWEQGKSIPDIDKLYELSVALGVDLITISGFKLKREKHTKEGEALNPEEQQLVADYREFNEEGKEKIREYVADLKDNPRYKKRDEFALEKQA